MLCFRAESPRRGARLCPTYIYVCTESTRLCRSYGVRPPTEAQGNETLSCGQEGQEKRLAEALAYGGGSARRKKAGLGRAKDTLAMPNGQGQGNHPANYSSEAPRAILTKNLDSTFCAVPSLISTWRANSGVGHVDGLFCS